MSHSKTPFYILPLIVISQFAGTSLWFAGNAILPAVQQQFNLPVHFVGTITIAVQLGFITGTLLFALTMLADRIKPAVLFFASSLLAALFNLSTIWFAHDATVFLLLRFFTGFFLAGVYPIGMKIASDWFHGGLGKALGYLVGALVLGTAFPHALKSFGAQFPWQNVLIATSVFATIGGICVLLFIKDGPYKQPASKFQLRAVKNVFTNVDFKKAAFGYFGHMWEIYTFWAFLPLMIGYYATMHKTGLNISLLSFYVIAAGSISCVIGGYIAKTSSSEKVAYYALLGSGVCCLLSPWFYDASLVAFISSFVVWGMLVTADSPQFSSLVAVHATKEYKGTALTLITCIGFAITVVSIQLMNYLWNNSGINPKYLMLVLAAGPVVGILQMKSRKNIEQGTRNIE
jgi:MFS family permease